MNFNSFDPEGIFDTAHIAGQTAMSSTSSGIKRSAQDAGLDRDCIPQPEDIDQLGYFRRKSELNAHSTGRHVNPTNIESLRSAHDPKPTLSTGKKTKGRVKIKMEFIDNKLRRYTTFSKRKTGIMKKAYELSTLTGTQVMLLVASETGHVYTFATRKLQPMITSSSGKALIQTCLNSPDPPAVVAATTNLDQRMSATGYEETELTYAVPDDEQAKSPSMHDDLLNGNTSGSESDTELVSPSGSPLDMDVPSPVTSMPSTSSGSSLMTPQIPPGYIFASNVPDSANRINTCLMPVGTDNDTAMTCATVSSPSKMYVVGKALTQSSNAHETGGSMMMGTPGGGVVYSTGGGLVYATTPTSDGSSPLLVNLPPELQQLASAGQDNGSMSQMLSLPMNLANVNLQPSSSTHNGSQSLPTDLSMHIKRERR